MKKNKISVKPYLNKRIQPVSITFTENGKNITVKLYPIYYQVIYKRKNTQFRTAYFKNGNEAFSHFFSLEESKYNQSDPQKVIENDKIIIEQIIRYLELMDEEFSLKGLNKKYDEYTIELAILINKILNSYIKHKLKMGMHYTIYSLLNYENNSYYNLYKASEELLGNHEFYTIDEKNMFELIKDFFNLYNKKDSPKEGFLSYHLDVPVNPIKNPKLIDLYSGKLSYNLSEKKVKEELKLEMIQTINRILNFKQYK